MGSSESTDATVHYREIVAFLESRSAGQVAHVARSLVEHLDGTYELLRSWGNTRDVCHAGLCHAAYGTDGFATALLDVRTERPMLADVIGADAEALVYLYASCDRAYLYPQIGSADRPSFRDRFTGATFVPDASGLRGVHGADLRERARHVPQRSRPGRAAPGHLGRALRAQPALRQRVGVCVLSSACSAGRNAGQTVAGGVFSFLLPGPASRPDHRPSPRALLERGADAPVLLPALRPDRRSLLHLRQRIDRSVARAARRATARWSSENFASPAARSCRRRPITTTTAGSRVEASPTGSSSSTSTNTSTIRTSGPISRRARGTACRFCCRRDTTWWPTTGHRRASRSGRRVQHGMRDPIWDKPQVFDPQSHRGDQLQGRPALGVTDRRGRVSADRADQAAALQVSRRQTTSRAGMPN